MNKKPINRAVVDRAAVTISARGKVLGRLATEVATILRGKDSVHFESHLLSGRPVIVTHAKDVIVTGNKLEDKKYYRHTGYLGNMKTETLSDMMKTKPDEVIRHAVRGMLPDNRLRQHWLAALEIREEE
ncbi:MAG TPA: 50S ribosomal protein L13 [Patescibacteria group bacterium]